MALDDGGAERRQIGVFQIVRRNENIGDVPRRLRSAVDGKMLRRRNHIGHVGVRPLHAGDKGHRHPPGQVRVLAIGFLTPAPTWIAENIDIGRPGVEAGADVPQVPALAPQRMQRPHLGADGPGDLVNQRGIKRSGQANRLGKIGCRHRADRAVQRFGPPVIGRNPQSRDARRDIHQLVDLFIQRHLLDQCRRLGVRQIANRTRRRLRLCAHRRQQTQGQNHHGCLHFHLCVSFTTALFAPVMRHAYPSYRSCQCIHGCANISWVKTPKL